MVFIHLAFTALPIVLQNSQTAKIVFRSIEDNIDNEMPALLFHRNNLDVNDVPANPNVRNEVAGQSQLAIVANLIANGAIFFKGPNIKMACKTSVMQ